VNDDQENNISSSVESDSNDIDESLKREELSLPGEEPTKPINPQFKSKRSVWQIAKKPLTALAALVLVVAIGFGVYKILNKNNSKPSTTQTSEQQATEQPASISSEASQLSENYTSNTLRLSFKYPSDWKVNEVDRGIRVESPTFTFTSKDKGEVDGIFRLYIRKGARSVDGKYLGDGYAFAPSTKLKYTDPASGQRDSTWLTDFGIKTTDNFAYFVVEGNYELKIGATLGPSFAKEADAYLIAGGYSKPDLTDDLATVLMPVDGYNQTSQYKTAVTIVQSLQLR